MKGSSSVKTHMSGSFASAAALVARRAYCLEAIDAAEISEEIRMEHRSYAIGAVIAAASYLEAGINELYLAAVDRNRNIFRAERLPLAERMTSVWKADGGVERIRVLDKYQETLKLAVVEPYPKGQTLYQSANGLVRLQNALVHYKPEWDTELEEHHKLEKMLSKKFAESPLAKPGMAFIPHRCLGYGCAAWSVKIAVGFYEDFTTRIGLNVPKIDPAGLVTE